MSRILLVGAGPLPFEKMRRFSAPGGRTWQLARPLLADGHELLLLALYSQGDDPAGREPVSPRPGLTCAPVGRGDLPRAGALLAEFGPDAVVATGMEQCRLAAALAGGLPFWADIYGDTMAEAQAKAAVYGDDHWVASFWGQLRPVLLRGDRFSAVSTRQRHALLGELASQGRPCSADAGRRLVHVMHSAVPGGRSPSGKHPVRGVRIGGDDFVVLWSGGYNTWADTDTLFRGLEHAMERNPSVRFVSTGGEIRDHDELTYPRFLDRVRRSAHRERFIMEGWVPRDEVNDYYFDADVGINADKYLYEGLLGCRTRLLDWASAGLPALTTVLCELSETLDRERLVATFPIGDHAALGEKILSLAADRKSLRAMGARAREYVLSRRTFEATTGPIRQWAAAPSAVDRRPDVDGLLHPRFGGSREELKAKLDELRSIKASGAYRLYKRLPGRESEGR